jgi:hypothetical protein
MPLDATRLGTNMFNAVNALAAGATEADAKARMIALAEAIIHEFKTQARIGSLSTTSTPADGAGHIHSPITVQATGKIS